MSNPLTDQLRALGVAAGDVVVVHTAFSEVRADGGPDAVIEALIEAVGPQGTIVMPSWTDEDDEVFDPQTDDVTDDLGVVADTFWRRPDVARGNHPFAVAAWGKHAGHIAGAPFLVPPHAPDSGIARAHDLDAKVLLLGVTHHANTTIHLAELLADVPYRVPNHITVVVDGRVERIDYGENDHCCEGFEQVGDWLDARGLQRTGPFAHGTARLLRARDVTATVADELADDRCRLLAHQPGGGCDECDRAWASVSP